MSWQDRDILDLKITTGDGKPYIVFWMNASLKVKWHGIDKSYIELPDSNVEKRKRQGRTFPLEFYFMGEDHLESAAAFRTSLDDPNPVTIDHPYYNTIVCQILELDIDNNQLNLSKCTCTAIETMVGYSAVISNPKDVVLLKKIELDALIDDRPEITPSVTDLNTLKDTTNKVQKLGLSIISLPEQAQEYINGFSTASSYINTFLESPILAMQALNSFLNMPAQFITKVEERINILKEQFDILRATINGLISPQSKLLYETQQVSILSTMCQTAVLPFPGDYTNAMEAVKISDLIASIFNELKEDLDSLQTSNNGNANSYIPDHDMYLKLKDMVALTRSSLYSFALSGRKQRSFTLTEDTCVILLAHKLLRLDADDNNIDELIKNNDFTYHEIALGIEKGRSIIYFI